MAEMLFCSRVLPAVSINYDGAVATPGQPAAAAAGASALLPRVMVVSSTPEERLVSGVGKTTFIDHIYSKCHGTDRVYISLHGELDPVNVSEPLMRETDNSRFIHLVLSSDLCERDGDEGSLDLLLFNLLVVGFVPCVDDRIAWLDDRDIIFVELAAPTTGRLCLAEKCELMGSYPRVHIRSPRAQLLAEDPHSHASQAIFTVSFHCTQLC